MRISDWSSDVCSSDLTRCSTGFARCLPCGTARQCCPRREGLQARCGSCPRQRSAAGSAAGYPSPPAPQGPSTAILNRRIWASYSFLRHYDEAQILLQSQPQISAVGADSGPAVYRRQVGGTIFRGMPCTTRITEFPDIRKDLGTL